jgi:hypothetical protein
MNDEAESLTPEQRRYAHAMFQVRIYQSNGQQFENLFVAVMTRRDRRFRPVKPQGPIGDQGNDGFIPEEGRYFQVYAPEDPKDKVDKAAAKARDDFGKLKDHWESDAAITDYRFVFNDKYQGSYPTVEHALAELKRIHGLATAKPFLAKDLEHEFWQLSTADKEAVLSAVIPRPQHIEDIDYAALTEILQHLVDNQIPIPAEGLPAVPDYDHKIHFNDIDAAADLLRVGNYQNAAVDQFFDKHGEFTRTDIRDRLAHSYEAAQENESNSGASDEGIGDRIFFRLLHSIAPNAAKQVQDAAIVLISYFFEKCDVFEDPEE